MISLRSARGGDTRERYESVLILHASRIDRLTDPFGRPVFSSSISCSRILCRIVYLRYIGVEMRAYTGERGHDSGPFQALRNITSRCIETAPKILALRRLPPCLLPVSTGVWQVLEGRKPSDPNEIEPSFVRIRISIRKCSGGARLIRKLTRKCT